MAAYLNNYLKHNSSISYLFIPLILLMSGYSLYAADIETARKEYMTGEYAKCVESAKTDTIGIISEDRGILLVKALMAQGKYEQAARELDNAIISEPLSLRLLMLGYKVNLYNGQAAKSAEMLSKINIYCH